MMNHMHTNHERGIALVLALFLMSALSVLGASLMFLSQTETYASMNYRMMSQARYAAEAGVHEARTFLVDSTQYPPRRARHRSARPTTTGPVAGRLPGRLPEHGSKQPESLVISVGVGDVSVELSGRRGQDRVRRRGNRERAHRRRHQPGCLADLRLVRHADPMQTFVAYGGTQNVVQTWEITVDGSLTLRRKRPCRSSRRSRRRRSRQQPYAAFATANTCDAIYFHGNVSTDSYDSSHTMPLP